MITSPNQTDNPLLIATASALGLGDLPIGSLESRAAARSLMAVRTHVEEQQNFRSAVTHDIYGNEINLQAMVEEEQQKEAEARRLAPGGERGDESSF
jgi:hypothetical protein